MDRFLTTRCTLVVALLAIVTLAASGCQTDGIQSAGRHDKSKVPNKTGRTQGRDQGLATTTAAAAVSVELLPSGKPNPATVAPMPAPITPPSKEDIQEGIQRGVAYLLATQNHDGSWGSARNTKGLNIYASVPGSHHAFRTAITALCISALAQWERSEPGLKTDTKIKEAIDKGEKYLLRELPRVRRADALVLYNNWTHAYGISALVDMRKRQPDNATRIAEIDKQIRQQIAFLKRYEFVDGGWGYYDFKAHTQKPSGSTTSFTTATVLVALHDAEQVGIKPPQEMVKRAIAALDRQRNSDSTYLYASGWKNHPRFSINKPGASLGRSQVCNLAMRRWGDKRITDGVLKAWLNRLYARNFWLDIGRKRPVPHESHMAVAGYFYYYGHFYAAMCIDELKPEQRPHFQQHLAHIFLERQEKDGSWFDFPFYNYHKAYGTAMAIMSLDRCR